MLFWLAEEQGSPTHHHWPGKHYKLCLNIRHPHELMSWDTPNPWPYPLVDSSKVRKRLRLDVSQRRTNLPERCHATLNGLSDHLAKETGAETVTIQ